MPIPSATGSRHPHTLDLQRERSRCSAFPHLGLNWGALDNLLRCPTTPEILRSPPQPEGALRCVAGRAGARARARASCRRQLAPLLPAPRTRGAPVDQAGAPPAAASWLVAPAPAAPH